MKLNKHKMEVIMAERLLSRNQMVNKCKVSRPTLRRAMSGKEVSPKTIGHIARGLGVEVKDIVQKSQDTEMIGLIPYNKFYSDDEE